MPAYYPLMVNLAGRPCVVVGGGEVAERKVETLLEFGAIVTVVSSTLTPALTAALHQGRIAHIARPYRPGDLTGAFLAIAATEPPWALFRARLLDYVRRRLEDPAEAEDLVQEVLARVSGRLPELRTREHLLPWLYRITLNTTRNRVRGKRPPMVPLDGAGEAPAEASARPAAVLERAERARMLGRLVAALPHRYRAAVVLRHVEGLSYAEIAGVLAQPEGTVKANVHRGLGLLRQALGEEEDAR